MNLHLKWRKEGVEGDKLDHILIVKAVGDLVGIFMAQYLVAFFPTNFGQLCPNFGSFVVKLVHEFWYSFKD